MFKCRPIFFECVHKVLIFLYVCVPLYTCTVHTICFTERSVSSQTYQIKLSFKKRGKNLPFSKHFNLFLRRGYKNKVQEKTFF